MAGGGIKITNTKIIGGANGKTPKFKVDEEGMLYYSYDNWETKYEIGNIKGPQGINGSMIIEVNFIGEVEDGYKYEQIYYDGSITEFIAPYGPQGEKGDRGAKIIQIQYTFSDDKGHRYEVDFEDGSTLPFYIPYTEQDIDLENGKGDYSIQGKNTEDRKNIAEGEASFAGGHKSKTYQRDTFAYGGSCQAGMTYQEWITANNKVADPKETNEAQISEYIISYGFSWAGGEENKAKGRSSFALIQRNIVTGQRSGAIGVENKVDGQYSLALGNNNEITDEYNQIVGTKNKARSKNSQMVGRELHTDTDKQVLLGHHNLRDENALLIVGNGAEDSGDKETYVGENGEINFLHRNAMTIKKNGAFHTDSRVTDTSLPVVEYYVENGEVKKRVVEGQYDKEILHIRNLSFGDKSVDLVIDKDGNVSLKTLNHNKENNLGEGYTFKQFDINQFGKILLQNTVEDNYANSETILDMRSRKTSKRQFAVKVDGTVVGGKSTTDSDEDTTLTTKDFVLKKISENGGSTSETPFELIETIITTGESKIERTLEPNGKKYAFDTLLVKIFASTDVSTSDTNYITCGLYAIKKTMQSLGGSYIIAQKTFGHLQNNTSKRYAYVLAIKNKGQWLGEAGGFGLTEELTITRKLSSLSMNTQEYPYAHHIIISGYASSILPIGMQIEIWGQRNEG